MLYRGKHAGRTATILNSGGDPLRIYVAFLCSDHHGRAYTGMITLFGTTIGVGLIAWAILKITEKIAEAWYDE